MIRVALLAVGLLAASPVWADDLEVMDGNPEHARYLVPGAAVGFCRDYWPICEAPASGPTDDVGLVEIVNREVNAAMRYRREAVDVWSVGVEAGDCDDYAVTKLVLMMRFGVPRDALRLATVLTETREPHMVLTVRTVVGLLVMDNRRAEVVKWDRTGYRWLATEWNIRGVMMAWRAVK